jgi:hypothetical protein
MGRELVKEAIFRPGMAQLSLRINRRHEFQVDPVYDAILRGPASDWSGSRVEYICSVQLLWRLEDWYLARDLSTRSCRGGLQVCVTSTDAL